MEWKLEVVVVPVSDVDRAKRFYGEQCGFVVDLDTRITDAFRVVQLTPPGSACSITIGTGLVDSAPGSLKGLQLVIPDLEAAPSGWTGAAGTGTRFSPSATPTATAGSCRSAPPTADLTAPRERSAQTARQPGWRYLEVHR